MSFDVINMVKREVERLVAGRYNRRIGLVTGYDPKTHSAKVMMQPDGVETGWVRIGTSHIGNKWGIAIGLVAGDGKKTGDQVELDFAEGDLEQGRITARIHSDKDQPPQVESGEISIISQFGHQIIMKKDGSMTLTTTQKDTPGENDNKSPNLTTNTTNGDVAMNSTKGTGDKAQGGSITHTSSDGNKKKHIVKLHPTDGITHSSTDGNQTHSVTIHPTNGITHTSSVAVNINAPASNMTIKNLNVQGFVNILANGDGTGGVLNAARGIGAPVTNAITGVVPTS